MRTIKTKDGKVHSGWNSGFTDKGTHIRVLCTFVRK